MLGRIFVFLLLCVMLGFFIWWVLKGGLTGVLGNTDFFQNPFVIHEDPETGLQLPTYSVPAYQGIELPYASDGETILAQDGRTLLDPFPIQEGLLAAEEEFDRLQKAAEDARNFGEPSPFKDSVYITYISSGLEDVAPTLEFLRLEASLGNTAPVSITGWSVQSLVSGKRAYLPRGVRTLHTGTVNNLDSISLDPGNNVIMTTGSSPVGVSFRENSCTGYLDQFQTFVPALDTFSCPRPGDQISATVENLQTYGDDCVSFVSRLDSCTLYTGPFYANITSQCRSFIQNALTYNGCVQTYQWRPSFVGDTWRVYLNQSDALWRPTHDVIRLLDAQGKTVDVRSY